MRHSGASRESRYSIYLHKAPDHHVADLATASRGFASTREVPLSHGEHASGPPTAYKGVGKERRQSTGCHRGGSVTPPDPPEQVPRNPGSRPARAHSSSTVPNVSRRHWRAEADPGAVPRSSALSYNSSVDRIIPFAHGPLGASIATGVGCGHHQLRDARLTPKPSQHAHSDRPQIIGTPILSSSGPGRRRPRPGGAGARTGGSAPFVSPSIPPIPPRNQRHVRQAAQRGT